MRDQAQIGETPPMAAFSRESLAACLMGGAMICAYMWDFRIHGIRLFDVVGLALLSGALALQFVSNWRNKPSPAHLSLSLLFIIYCTYSFFYAHHKSSIAIAMGALIFFATSTYDKTLRKILPAYMSILTISIVIFLFRQWHIHHLMYLSIFILFLTLNQECWSTTHLSGRPASFRNRPATAKLYSCWLASLRLFAPRTP